MQKTLWSKLFRTGLVLILCTGLVACNKDSYKVKDYLLYLANASGISESEELTEYFKDLHDWKVVKATDYELLEEELDVDVLTRTLNALLEDEEEMMDILSDLEIKDKVSKEKAEEAVNKVVELINHKEFSSDYDYTLNEDIESVPDRESIPEEKEGIFYIEEEEQYLEKKDGEFRECDFEDLYEDFNLSESFEIDFSDAEVKMNGEEEETSYTNLNYELLSTTRKTFNVEGVRVSYSLNTSGISFRVSKSIKDGISAYGDITISNIKPSISYHFEDKKLTDAYLSVDYKTTSRFGFSTTRYKKLAADFKNVDTSSFMNMLKSVFKEQQDTLEVSIPICTIETPIPNVPTATFNIDVLLKLYASGKAEIVLYDSNSFGFELKDGKTRTISEVDKNYDCVLRASGKTALGLNFNVNAAKYRLMDVELDGGVKAVLKTTVHLYDKDGEAESQSSDLSYDAADTLASENEDVEVCGDVSLQWVLDLKINTYKTLLYKYGLSYTKEFLDEDDQIFGNLHHIEDGQFVKKCTRTNRTKYNTKSVTYSSDHIALDTYSIVLKKNESYTMDPIMPDGYTVNDFRYSPDKEGIITIENNTITARESGAVKLKISTNDELYETYLNILVSYE